MSIPLLLLLYGLSAAVLVFFSIKCADYVDLLDKKTNLSGAFIGGVILAAVTSLPELVTSISAVYVVHNAELIIGNVVGSNIFNLCIFGGTTALSAKAFAKSSVGRSHFVTMLCTVIADVLIAVTLLTGFGEIPVVHINIVSLLIMVIYVISLRFLSADESENEEADTSDLTVRQIVPRFVLMATGLVVMSVVVTWFTDSLQEQLNLGASLAGALFLGVATSLPELSSSIALVRRRNYNAMVGNVLGSNVFNFTILAVADVIAGGTAVYIHSADTLQMLMLGAVSTALVAVSVFLARRDKTAAVDAKKAVCPFTLLGIGICALYIVTLII